MKTITVHSLPVLVESKIRHGEIIIKRHRRYCSVRWTIGLLDKCYVLSDDYLGAGLEEVWQWYKSNFRTWLHGAAQNAFVCGSLRWGKAQGLTIESAEGLAQSINRKWTEKIRRWMADGRPAKRSIHWGRQMRVGSTWGCE